MQTLTPAPVAGSHAASHAASQRAPRIGLVLGAGGITGIAWLAGALRALEAHTGWDPRTADVMVGTSAGAVAATVLAAGHDPADLLLYCEQPETLKEAILEARCGRLPDPRSLPLPASMRLGLSGLLRPTVGRLSGFLPTGLISNDEIRGLTHRAVADGWPTHTELWLNACDARSGEPVAFGRAGSPDASLADAVVASCAVPSYYRPVTIGGRIYIDGGVRSFTNADLLLGAGCDVVIVLAPFSSMQRGPLVDTAIFGIPRRVTAMRTAREVTRLRNAGAAVISLSPSGADIRAMGLNPMERAHSRAVVETATISAAAQLRLSPSPEDLAEILGVPSS